MEGEGNRRTVVASPPCDFAIVLLATIIFAAQRSESERVEYGVVPVWLSLPLTLRVYQR